MGGGWAASLLVLAFAVSLLPSSAWSEEKSADSVRLTFIHVNDVHGHLEAHREGEQLVGGYARLSTLVTEVREAKTAERVFLIHAGDEVNRGDALSTRSHGAANVAILNFLKFDLWTPGNGEFYQGNAVIEKRIAEAHFPVLTSNALWKKTGKPVGRLSAVLPAGPVKVAFFGLCTVRNPTSEGWDLEVEAPAKTAQRLVPQLRKEADLVVAVTHIGFSEDTALAQAVEGLDLIIGGHSHTAARNGMRVKDPAGRTVLVCQAGEHLKYAGRVDLTVKRKDGKWEVAEAAAKLVPLDEKVRLDAAVTGLIARLAQETKVPVGAR